jgi:hypothetical protein
LCRKAAALRFDIRHIKKTSLHLRSIQPSTIQHPTGARRHS